METGVSIPVLEPLPRSDQQLADALTLMDAFVRLPLGQDHERDEKIKAVWRSNRE